jgi:putative transcriptional regulator
MSDILKVMRETAKDLHEAGAMDMATMREIESLCLPEIKTYTPTQIKRIRAKSKASQTVYLNTSASAVQKWESGQKHPNGPSLKLLNIVDRRGIDVLGGQYTY